VKVNYKISQDLPTNYHLKERKYYGHVCIGGKNYYTEVFDDEEEAVLELRCLEKRLSFETIETVQGEGYYPERSIIIEEMYQQSGRTNGLYTGLNVKDGSVSLDSSGQ
jgi:hypothetical protein